MRNAAQVDLAMVRDLSNKLGDDVQNTFKRMAELVPMMEMVPTIYLHATRRAMALTAFSLSFFLAPGDEMTLPDDRERLVSLVLCNLIANTRAHDDQAAILDATFATVRMMAAAGLAPHDDAFLDEIRRHLSSVPRETSTDQRTAATVG
jgi:hypothetical protein